MAPQHYVPPSVRDLRAQAVQRLQAGLFGLSAIVLVFGLANIIKDRAELNGSGARTVASTAAEPVAGVSDPLADIGVVPSAAPDANTTAPSPQPGGNTN
jgi:hypothetical protein